MPVDRTSHLVQAVADGKTQRRSFYRAFVQFLCSNLGLVLLVIAYSVGGAFLFQLLEQYIELQNCQQGNLQENVTVVNISQSLYTLVLATDKNTTTKYAEITNYLENFTNDVYVRRNESRYTGQPCSNTSSWSFPSALLFTITVITTIGYGHVTPVSWEGQITCICYALIGIPIFLLCLANISSVLGDIFRFMYSALLHCFCCVCRVYTRNRNRRNRAIRAVKIKDTPGIDYTGTTSIDPSWPEAYNSNDGRINDDYDYYNDKYDEQDDIWDRMESRVPFGAVILIIIGYVCLGAFMFHRFENWSMIQSVYFCYVTLATVGFGDFVPGITSKEASGLRFVLASLYILFGLAILAMCFDLIKEGIVDKFHWLASKLGILSEDEDQVDEDHTQYANFEYDTTNQQRSRENSGKIQFGKNKINGQFGEPPSYDSESGDGKWVKNIRDKPDSASSNEQRKANKIKDEKH